MSAIAVLKMSRCMGDKIIKASDILNKLQNNAYIISMWNPDVVSLTDFETHVQNFIDAEANTKQRTVGLVSLRDAALAVLMEDLREIRTMVQIIAHQAPDSTEAVIQSAGFGVKKSGHRPKQINAAYNTQIPGTVKLTAEGTRAHEWEMSKDRVNITSLPATQTAYTYVKNLTPGDVIYFRTRKLCTNKTQYNWSPWMILFIGGGGITKGTNNSTNAAGSITA